MTNQPNPPTDQPASAQPPAEIPLAQVPTLINVGQVMADGRAFVMLRASTPSGTNTYFLDPDAAATIGDHLQRMGKQSATGLIVPPTIGLMQ